MAQSFEQYAQMHTQPQQYAGVFEIPDGNQRMLEVNFGVPSTTGAPLQMVWTKHGAMVAYRGDVHFQRETILEEGVGNIFKKSMTGEGMMLTKATSNGRAQLYLADAAKQITIFRLQGESVSVNGKSLLAFEPTINHKTKMLRSTSSIVSGGLFNVHLSGHGLVAVSTHGRAVTLRVGPEMPPVFTAPHATVAWSGDIVPDFQTDIQLKTFFGRGSGESFQMKFDGSNGPPGFVLVQPSEEYYQPPPQRQVV